MVLKHEVLCSGAGVFGVQGFCSDCDITLVMKLESLVQNKTPVNYAVHPCHGELSVLPASTTYAHDYTYRYTGVLL